MLRRLDLRQGDGAALARGIHGLPGARGLALQALDQHADLLGRTLGAAGEAAHLVGNYRETAALLTGPCCLDGCVERQQVGLLGDAADHVEHLADLVAVEYQLLHHVRQAIDMATERADGADRFVHHGAAGIGLLLGDVSGIGGLDSAACNLLGGGEHFIHGSSDLIDLRLLAFHIARAVPGQVRHVLALPVSVIGRLAHAADHLANLTQQAVVGQGDPAHLVIGMTHLKRRGKIALADLLQAPAQLVDLQHQPVHPGDPSEHHQQQDAQGGTQRDPQLLGGTAIGLRRDQRHHFVGGRENIVGVAGQGLQIGALPCGQRLYGGTVALPDLIDALQVRLCAGQLDADDTLGAVAVEQQPMGLLEALNGLVDIRRATDALRSEQRLFHHLLAEHALRAGHVDLAGVLAGHEQHPGGQRRAKEDQAVGKEKLQVDGT